MKFRIALIFSLILSISFAQTNKEARALLEEVKAKTLSFKTQKITFDNSIEIPSADPAKAGTKRNMQGVISLKGEAYRLELNGMIYLNDGKSMYIIDPDIEEIDVTTTDDGEMPLSPTSILSEFDKGYSLKLGDKKTVSGKKIQYVILKPTGASDISLVEIGVDMSTKTVYSYKMTGTNKVITILTITDYKTDLNLPANTFVFNKADWPGYYINN
ncbi:MAG: outer membrane lipoprotein carrier protein LolA [Schleiferiaceae bacterium]|jgi:outer membrane lipoprotein-sorting protein|nr:outer membrane lipoprotein carrier protein LolA [Schleiferiaceae bacterium]